MPDGNEKSIEGIMRLIRLIKRDEWDPDRKRFTSPAFEPSSDEGSKPGGISLIDKQCILDSSGDVCAHIRRWRYTPDPEPIYWEFSSNILGEHELEYEPSASGDDCHLNIIRLGEKSGKKMFKSAKKIFKRATEDLSVFRVCHQDRGNVPLSANFLR